MARYYCRGEEAAHCTTYNKNTEQCDYCKWYCEGNGLPHFPVPAIQVKYFFHPEYINVVKYNGRQGIYGPGYETIHEWVHQDCEWKWRYE